MPKRVRSLFLEKRDPDFADKPSADMPGFLSLVGRTEVFVKLLRLVFMAHNAPDRRGCNQHAYQY